MREPHLRPPWYTNREGHQIAGTPDGTAAREHKEAQDKAARAAAEQEKKAAIRAREERQKHEIGRNRGR